MSFKLSEPSFSLDLPLGFEAFRDADGLHCVRTDPPGVFHFLAEFVEDPDALPSLARMLASFLTRSGHPVATDDLLQITSVPEVLGYSWQLVTSETFQRFWVFGNDMSWVFIVFLCPTAYRDQHHDELALSLKTLRLTKER